MKTVKWIDASVSGTPTPSENGGKPGTPVTGQQAPSSTNRRAKKKVQHLLALFVLISRLKMCVKLIDVYNSTYNI